MESCLHTFFVKDRYSDRSRIAPAEANDSTRCGRAHFCGFFDRDNLVGDGRRIQPSASHPGLRAHRLDRKRQRPRKHPGSSPNTGRISVACRSHRTLPLRRHPLCAVPAATKASTAFRGHLCSVGAPKWRPVECDRHNPGIPHRSGMVPDPLVSNACRNPGVADCVDALSIAPSPGSEGDVYPLR